MNGTYCALMHVMIFILASSLSGLYDAFEETADFEDLKNVSARAPRLNLAGFCLKTALPRSRGSEEIKGTIGGSWRMGRLGACSMVAHETHRTWPGKCLSKAAYTVLLTQAANYSDKSV